MKAHDAPHVDGSRSIQIRTACGFEITLMRTIEGRLKLLSYFNNTPYSLTNTQMGLSKEGALELAATIEEIYSNA